MGDSLVIGEAFERLYRQKPGKMARGWYNIDCPACGDRRQRLGLRRTEDGGFLAYCQNGGCTYHDKATGWKPGSGLRGRLADLFVRLGGDIKALPEEEVNRIRPESGFVERTREIRTSFPEMALPPGCIPLWDALEKDKRSHPVGEWVIEKRSEVYLYPEYRHYLYWSALTPKKLCIAFWHYDKIVGYLTRDTTQDSAGSRFMQRSASNYLFGQDRVASLPGNYVIVVESPMDAILLHGVATRSSRPTQMQINFLLESGKTPIWVPDLKDSEGVKFIEVAEANKHLFAIPDWEFKDPGEAFVPLGVLRTADLIMKARTDRYVGAIATLKIKGR